MMAEKIIEKMFFSYHGEAMKNGHAADQSWYHASAKPWTAQPVLSGAHRADIVVVGGGYTGLTAALDLAERGYQVVLLEAHQIGWGASGRNGGQVIGGFSPDRSTIEKNLGRLHADQLAALSDDALALLKDRIARHRIDCDLRWGFINAAEKPRQVRECRHLAEQDAIPGGLFLDRSQMAVRVGSEHYQGGFFDPNSGHLHPLDYARGLGRAAITAGVSIFEHSAVVNYHAENNQVTVTTAQGEVTATNLILAGNAYIKGVAPRIEPFIMPIGTHIIATAPLSVDLAARIMPDRPAVCDMNFVLNYFRLSADRRLLFGGRVSYSGFEMPHVTDLMRKTMVKIFPDLADVPVDHSWGGLVDISLNRLPHLGQLEKNVFFAQGFSGHGVVLTGMAGRVLADAVAGQLERFDVFSRIRHQPFPGGRLFRKPSLVLAMLWYRLRDLL